MRKIWLRAALAAGAGLASLVVCPGVLVAIVFLLSNTTEWSLFMGGSTSWPSATFWVGLVILMSVAAAGLSLPARALGARGGHITKTALLSVLGFWASVVLAVVVIVMPYAAVFALMTIVATPLIGSLFAIREEYHYTARMG